MAYSSSSPRPLLAIAFSLIISIGFSLVIWQAEKEKISGTTPENPNHHHSNPIPWQSYSTLGLGLLLTSVWGRIYWRSQQEQQSLQTKIAQQQIDFHQQLNQSQQDLKQARESNQLANHAKQEFLSQLNHQLLSQLNHQLCSPLYTIIGYTQLLQQDRELSQVNRSYLAILRRNSDNLLKLLRELLEISQIQTGQREFQPLSFNLYHCLESLKTRFESPAISKGLTLTFYVPPDIPSIIITDERKLTKILRHLLDNGIKHTQKGGVTLRLGIGDHQWILEEENKSQYQPPICDLFIEIEDTGCGMDSQQLDNIFVPFSLEHTEPTLSQCSGLSLVTCEQLIKLMGGTMNINSKINQGTLVTLKLPVKLSYLESSAEFALPLGRAIALAPNQPSYRILIVDDKRENRQLLLKLLDPLGFQLQEAQNGQEALQIYSDWHPHLIWLDPKMPVMDGYTAANKIKQLQQQNSSLDHDHEVPQTIIIALCSSILASEQAKLLASGYDDVIYKPIDFEVILDKMAEHLGLLYIYQEEEENPFIQEQAASKIMLSSLTYSSKNRILSDANNQYQILETNTNTQENTILDLNNLSSMNSEWITSFHQSACAGDSRKIYQLIEEITLDNPLLAKQLKELVHQFNFRYLQELSSSISPTISN